MNSVSKNEIDHLFTTVTLEGIINKEVKKQIFKEILCLFLDGRAYYGNENAERKS